MSTHDIALIAAQEWARANAPGGRDPVEFGNKVALAYCSCRATQYNAGDEKATAAALASLSVRPEVLQLIAQLASLTPGRSMEQTQTDSVGTE